jgi:phosphate transport system permease protein
MSVSNKDIKNLNSKDIRQKAVDKRMFYDKLATVVVAGGGVAIILCIIAILFFIGIETVPLLQSPNAELQNNFTVEKAPVTVGQSSNILIVGTEEYTEIAFLFDDQGVASFVSLESGLLISETPIVNTEEQGVVTSTFASEKNEDYAAATSKGWVIPFSLKYNVTYGEDNKRNILPQIIQSDPIKLSDESIDLFGYKTGEFGNSSVTAFVTENSNFIFHSIAVSDDEFMDQEESITNSVDLTTLINVNSISAIQIDSFLNNLYVGTTDGKIYNWDIRNKFKPELQDVIKASTNSKTGITSLGFLTGSRSLFVGLSDGTSSIWFPARDESGKPVLTRVHEFDKLEGQITGFAKSSRDRGFVINDDQGNVGIYHTTSGSQQIKFEGEGKDYNSITFAPKSNGVVVVDKDGAVKHWMVDNPHPETNFKTLFGKVWYEGYSEPEYVWQSTGGTDEFEPKFSLTPLIYGTLKGAFYALLFAIPLAILSAICVSQFMHPNHRNKIKPIIEIMAALPSVVLGFFAGLWMAPVIEKIFPAVIAMFILIPLFTIISVFAWQKVPNNIKSKLRVGTELYFLIPVIIAGVLIALGLNTTIESALFGGDYKEWFYTVLGLQYDQRNALIVGFAMGFAVIPIIFTISEDALSSVPNNLTSGSLALGASRWQTAINIVLPSASPGIFSAVMIGLGRAIGETMIVLMATGNTPIMDWSFFNGFRALSANIAVELPEAPHGGTLYRILFLAALILFFFTFLLNTLAEIIRQRLRKKYGQL